MDADFEQAVEDIDLQRCINDLARLLDSSAQLTEVERPAFLQTLLDALVAMLHLDFAYARLGDDGTLARIEALRFSSTSLLVPQSQSLSEALRAILEAPRTDQVLQLSVRVAGDNVSVVRLRLGEIGDLVAGARRASFPNESERVVLTVATNQTTI